MKNVGNLSEGVMANVPSPEQLQRAMRFGDWSDLKIKPKANCNRCLGRGYEGKNTQTGKYVPCKCIFKQLDKPFKLKLGSKK
jgi:hypothetical protein